MTEKEQRVMKNRVRLQIIDNLLSELIVDDYIKQEEINLIYNITSHWRDRIIVDLTKVEND